jgi:Phosphotransferase enzyme family
MGFQVRMRVDLREHAADIEIQRVADAFSTTLATESARRSRRTIGLRSDRDTWVRIEARPVEHIEGWNGAECSSTLCGVARPEWHRSVTWRDGELMWRADETALVTDETIKRGPILTEAPDLSDAWWATLTGSLAALARHATTRVATQTMLPLTQERVTALVRSAYPDVDATIDEWTAAHGDFGWQNLTAPGCVILDWEDWGMAPRGYDAAILWHTSLAVPALADRVYRELRADLDTRSGLLSQLMFCAMAARVPPGFEQLTGPALAQAPRILAQLG